jgi:hypothetical protein
MFNPNGPFELTADGYELAMSWLTRSGHWDKVSPDSKPMDGYSVVSLANELLEKEKVPDGFVF